MNANFYRLYGCYEWQENKSCQVDFFIKWLRSGLNALKFDDTKTIPKKCLLLLSNNKNSTVGFKIIHFETHDGKYACPFKIYNNDGHPKVWQLVETEVELNP